MLTAETAAMIVRWKAHKQAQWQRIAPQVSAGEDGKPQVTGLTGLQFITFGYRGTDCMLNRSTDDFYEGIIIGRLPHALIDESGAPTASALVDLSDEQIDRVLATWAAGESALTLDFIACVWGPDGKPRWKQ